MACGVFKINAGTAVRGGVPGFRDTDITAVPVEEILLHLHRETFPGKQALRELQPSAGAEQNKGNGANKTIDKTLFHSSKGTCFSTVIKIRKKSRL